MHDGYPGGRWPGPFRSAQEHGDPATFARALRELHQGSKESHWIWYVFPRLRGLGQSRHARTYGLQDEAEARAYLLDPVLASRYRQALEALISALTPDREISAVLGELDARKTISSATLMRQVLRNTASPLPEELATISTLIEVLLVGTKPVEPSAA